MLDPGHAGPTARQPSRPRIAGLARRQDWYFVGRRAEQRRWPADLTGTSLAGIVIGGIGETTLAAEITTRVREPGRVLVTLTGPLTLETLLGAVITTIRRELLISGHGQGTAAVIRALDVAARADLGWQDRLAILRGHVLDHVPVLLLLDNFEDNLHPHGDAGYAVMRCWPGCWPRGWLIRAGAGCWSPAGTGSRCPAGRSGFCRSGRWGRCRGRRR